MWNVAPHYRLHVNRFFFIYICICSQTQQQTPKSFPQTELTVFCVNYHRHNICTIKGCAIAQCSKLWRSNIHLSICDFFAGHWYLFLFERCSNWVKCHPLDILCYKETIFYDIHNSNHTQWREMLSLESHPCNLKSDSAISNKEAHSQIENAKLHVSLELSIKYLSFSFAIFLNYIQQASPHLKASWSNSV